MEKGLKKKNQMIQGYGKEDNDYKSEDKRIAKWNWKFGKSQDN